MWQKFKSYIWIKTKTMKTATKLPLSIISSFLGELLGRERERATGFFLSAARKLWVSGGWQLWRRSLWTAGGRGGEGKWWSTSQASSYAKGKGASPAVSQAMLVIIHPSRTCSWDQPSNYPCPWVSSYAGDYCQVASTSQFASPNLNAGHIFFLQTPPAS